MAAQRQALDPSRWHFQHGPIDAILSAEGEADAVQAAHAQAWQRFEGLLQTLVDELPILRAPVGSHCPLRSTVARTMWQAAAVHRPAFVTPMVAVAGAVAQTLLQAYQRPGITRAWVNNGGDIALHLSPGTRHRVGWVANIDQLRSNATGRWAPDGFFDITHDSPVRGVATSGWRGRSLSMGIADSVTVLAASAAQADAAATLIANAVNVDAPGIVRVPANTLQDGSDLGERLVTQAVPALSPVHISQALSAGLAHAQALRAAGHIHACFLSCQGWALSTTTPQPSPTAIDGPRAAPRAQALALLP